MRLGPVILMLLSALTLAGQPPPPAGRGSDGPGQGGPPPPGGPDGIRRRMAQVKAPGELPDKILGFARVYLDRSEAVQRSSPYTGTRYRAAADAMVRAAEHQQHLLQRSGPEPPDGVEIAHHLDRDRAYFRLQQADFFVKQSGDPNAKAIAAMAQHYYQETLRASESRDWRRADEGAKTVDELMRALENLAQSTAPPAPPPPPKARPGKP